MGGLEQMHMHAYLAKEAVCLDLHVSKGGFKESDRRLFEELFSSVMVVDVKDQDNDQQNQDRRTHQRR